jgi:hypothetical protein
MLPDSKYSISSWTDTQGISFAPAILPRCCAVRGPIAAALKARCPCASVPVTGGYVHALQVYRSSCRSTRLFVSSIDSEVAGLTGNRTGDDLPAYLAPWLFRGSTFMPEADPRPDTVTICAAIIQGANVLCQRGSSPDQIPQLGRVRRRLCGSIPQCPHVARTGRRAPGDRCIGRQTRVAVRRRRHGVEIAVKVRCCDCA